MSRATNQNETLNWKEQEYSLIDQESGRLPESLTTDNHVIKTPTSITSDNPYIVVQHCGDPLVEVIASVIQTNPRGNNTNEIFNIKWHKKGILQNQDITYLKEVNWHLPSFIKFNKPKDLLASFVPLETPDEWGPIEAAFILQASSKIPTIYSPEKWYLQRQELHVTPETIRELYDQVYRHIDWGRTFVDITLNNKVFVYKNLIKDTKNKKEAYYRLKHKAIENGEHINVRIPFDWTVRKDLQEERKQELRDLVEYNHLSPYQDEWNDFKNKTVKVYQQLIYFYFGLGRVNVDTHSTAKGEVNYILHKWGKRKSSKQKIKVISREKLLFN
jgi:hypothetical protein